MNCCAAAREWSSQRVLNVTALPEPVPSGESWLQFARTPAAIGHLLALGRGGPL